MKSIITFAILISFVVRITFQYKKHQWCYCSDCPCNIKYCSLLDGVCYKRNESGITRYGCMSRVTSYSKCPAESNQISNNFLEDTARRSTVCCDSSAWCSGPKPDTKGLNLDFEDLHNVFRPVNRTCICSNCGDVLTCQTAGLCYMKVTFTQANTRKIYSGCYTADMGNCPLNKSMSQYSKGLRCCDEGNYCNADPNFVNTGDILIPENVLKVRHVRLERTNDGLYTASFNLKMISGLSNRFQVEFSQMRLSTYIESIVDDNTYPFKAQVNDLYKISYAPAIHYTGIASHQISFYLTRLHGRNVSWLPDVNGAEGKVIDVVCQRCVSKNIPVKHTCHSCDSYDETTTNPIWIYP